MTKNKSKQLVVISEPKARQSSYLLLIILTFLISMFSIITAAYSYYLLKHLPQPKPIITHDRSDYTQIRMQVAQQVKNLQNQIETLDQQLETLQKQTKQPAIINTTLLHQITTLQQDIISLPLKKSFQFIPENTIPTSPSPWKNHLANSLNQIKSIIIIRHHNTPIEPQRSPEERALLNERLQLTFQEAAWAVLQQNQDVYLWALRYIQSTVEQQFDINQPETKAFLTSLNNLLTEKTS